MRLNRCLLYFVVNVYEAILLLVHPLSNLALDFINRLGELLEEMQLSHVFFFLLALIEVALAQNVDPVAYTFALFISANEHARSRLYHVA
mmetsp:Transcript_15757/g.19810  ORF Transcript_15757/g.19810 Transcript_15757/m.19810 type:complete len:90 (-) Transcript_15757:63-332(-)